MGFQDYISESEAAGLATVSPTTLARFADAGYLNIEHDSDGLRMFSRAEIEKVFSVPQKGSSTIVDLKEFSEVKEAIEAPASVIESNDELPDSSPSPNLSTAAPEHAPGVTPTERLADQIEVVRTPIINRQPAARVAESAVEPQTKSEPAEPSVLDAVAQSRPLGSAQSSPEGKSSPDGKSEAPLTKLTEELIRLQNIERDLQRFKVLVDMQERLLDSRELEIKEIKAERDWLRQRVERAEEKQDRDQLLLLSETQTIRKLVSNQEGKKSSFQYALEWFGFRAPSDSKSTALISAHSPSSRDVEISAPAVDSSVGRHQSVKSGVSSVRTKVESVAQESTSSTLVNREQPQDFDPPSFPSR